VHQRAHPRHGLPEGLDLDLTPGAAASKALEVVMSRSLVVFATLAAAGCAGVDDGALSAELTDAESDWAQLGRSPRHTAWNPYETVIDAASVSGLRVLWSCCEPGRRSEVALWQGQVFATNTYRPGPPTPPDVSYVAAFDVASGDVLWQGPPDTAGRLSNPVGQPAVGYGKLFVQDENRFVTLATRDGAFLPTVVGLPNMDVLASSTVAARRAFYLHTDDLDDGENRDRLRAYGEDGTALWSTPIPGRVREPAIANDRIWTAVDDRYLQAFDLDSGAALWRTPDAGAVIGSPSISGGRVYAVAYPNTLRAYAETTGDVVWTATFTGGANTPNPPAPSPPAVDDSRVYIGVDKAAGGIAVGAFDANTGVRRWGVIVGTSQRSGLLAVAGGVVYVPAADGTLTALDATTGRTVTTFTFPSAVRSPIVGGGHLVVPTASHGVSVLGL
jgi:outer membrane protein assembly factor BamB